MSRYVVRVVGPAGRETYLAQGREVDDQEVATHYPHPSNAWQAADAYRLKTRNIVCDVVDTRDPESVVPLA